MFFPFKVTRKKNRSARFPPNIKCIYTLLYYLFMNLGIKQSLLSWYELIKGKDLIPDQSYLTLTLIARVNKYGSSPWVIFDSNSAAN